MIQWYGVSFPFGHNHQYDVVGDKYGTLFKIQVKNSKSVTGEPVFHPS
jgi:hypothetical protein